MFSAKYLGVIWLDGLITGKLNLFSSAEIQQNKIRFFKVNKNTECEKATRACRAS